jgi:homoserine kinase
MATPSSAVVRAFAPASASNIACGFDIFGFAAEGWGDTVEARRREEPGVVLTAIEGDDGVLPREAAKNTAGIAVMQFLAEIGAPETGIALRLTKGMPLRSGLGSSAASAVAALTAVNALLGAPLAKERLLAAAVAAEAAACGSAHADNAAPSLYGGFVLVRGGARPEVTPLPVPAELTCAFLHPPLEVDTGAARKLLGDHIPLHAAVTQWGNTAALVAALFREDWALLQSALVDVVAEPVRSRLVPGFAQIQAAARAEGALGCSLSGSGPTLFALCRGLPQAERAAAAMATALTTTTGLTGETQVTRVGAAGARVLP